MSELVGSNLSEIDGQEAERNHWKRVMRTMLLYEDFLELEFQRRQDHINRLSIELSNRLPEISFEKFNLFRNAMKNNQDFLYEIVQYYVNSELAAGSGSLIQIPDKYAGDTIRFTEQRRNEAILHSAYREWSKEGSEERSKSFLPLLNALKEYLPVTESNAFTQRVLVPGCGLARLPVEIAASGYSCEGNEFSAFMVMSSNFLLNGITTANEFNIHPWTCNVVKALDPVRSYSIPDVAAVDILEKGPYHHIPNTSHSIPRFSFAAGDFMQIYGNEANYNSWDAVITCFFIDTAPVVLEYIQLIQQILRPGGLWINLGPLLYHWVADEDHNHDPRYDQSVELSWEEVQYVVNSYGFDIIKENDISTSYNCCRDSMLLSMYRAKFFVATKLPEAKAT